MLLPASSLAPACLPAAWHADLLACCCAAVSALPYHAVCELLWLPCGLRQSQRCAAACAEQPAQCKAAAACTQQHCKHAAPAALFSVERARLCWPRSSSLSERSMLPAVESACDDMIGYCCSSK